MPIRTALWKVAEKPEPLAESSLAREQLLEAMIVASPRLLSDEWRLIGRQEDTGSGGRVDLLAIAPDGLLVLIELKRDRTPRDVVVQALDYAGWVEKLRTEDIAAIYSRYAPGRSLAQDYRQRFGQDLDEETLNQNHQIIIVSGSLDDSTERIVDYLSAPQPPSTSRRPMGRGGAFTAECMSAWLAGILSRRRHSEPLIGRLFLSAAETSV